VVYASAASPCRPAVKQGLTLVHFRLNASAFCGMGGAFRGCLGGVQEVRWRMRVYIGCILCKKRLRLS